MSPTPDTSRKYPSAPRRNAIELERRPSYFKELLDLPITAPPLSPRSSTSAHTTTTKCIPCPRHQSSKRKSKEKQCSKLAHKIHKSIRRVGEKAKKEVSSAIWAIAVVGVVVAAVPWGYVVERREGKKAKC